MQLKDYEEYFTYNVTPAFHKLCGFDANRATIHHADFSRHNVLGKAGIEDDDEAIIEYLYQWHHKENGWQNGIGYHIVITPDGRILLTYRGLKGIAGAHCKKRTHPQSGNSGNIGVLVWGDFNGEEYPTEAQEKAIKVVRLFLEGICSIEDFYLHRDLNDTNCPGVNFPVELWK